MKISFLSLISIIIFLIPTLVFSSENPSMKIFKLVENGKAANILIDKNAGQAGKFAAGELARYVEKMTGIKPQIITPEKSVSPLIKICSYSATDIQPGSFTWGVEDNGSKLIIKGAKSEGIIFAVYELLENQCGIHWFAPGQKGEYIPPKCSTLSIHSEGKIYSPAFRRRWIHYYRDIAQSTATLLDLWDWALKNRLNGTFCVRNSQNRKPEWDVFLSERGMPGDRIWGDGILIPAAQFGNDHPEYYPLIDGKRQVRDKVKYCLTNPDVMRFHIESLLDSARKHPQDNFWRLPHSWWQRWCNCDACLADCGNEPITYGQLRTDYLLKFLDKMIRESDNKSDLPLPDIYVPIRMDTEHPPFHIKEIDKRLHFALDENHSITTIPSYQNSNMAASLDKTLNCWGQITQNMILSDAIFSAGSLLAPIEKQLSIRYKYLKSISCIEGIDLLVRNDWGNMALVYWLAAKLLWNPDADMKSAINTYHNGYYGPAAFHISKIREALSSAVFSHQEDATYQDLPVFMNHAYKNIDLSSMESLIDDARKAAFNTPYLSRVEDYSLSLQYMCLGIKLASEGDYTISWNENSVKLLPTGITRKIADLKNDLFSFGITSDSQYGIQWALGSQKTFKKTEPVTWKIVRLKSDTLEAVIAVDYGGTILKLNNVEGTDGFQILPLKNATIEKSGLIGGWHDSGPDRYSAESWKNPYDILEQTQKTLVLTWIDQKNSLQFTKNYCIENDTLQYSCTIKNIGSKEHKIIYCTQGFPRLGEKASDDIVIINTENGNKMVDLHNTFGTMASYEKLHPEKWWGAYDKTTGWILVNYFEDMMSIESWQTWDRGGQYTMELISAPVMISPNKSNTWKQSLGIRKISYPQE